MSSLAIKSLSLNLSGNLKLTKSSRSTDATATLQDEKPVFATRGPAFHMRCLFTSYALFQHFTYCVLQCVQDRSNKCISC